MGISQREVQEDLGHMYSAPSPKLQWSVSLHYPQGDDKVRKQRGGMGVTLIETSRASE